MITYSLTHSRKGFTLSELLISLSVLGLISALTLPAVFNAVEQQKRKALLKETLHDIQVMIQAVAARGQGNINTIDLFPRELSVTECKADLGLPGVVAPEIGGCIFLNGVYVYGMNGTTKIDGIGLDYNGIAPPNLTGRDRITVGINWGDVDSTGLSLGLLRPGEMKPYSTSETAYAALYE
jgi:prepilin-type N-terminal cleavage/methylation domain-containing protein